jgi:hypothetical protein
MPIYRPTPSFCNQFLYNNPLQKLSRVKRPKNSGRRSQLPVFVSVLSSLPKALFTYSSGMSNSDNDQDSRERRYPSVEQETSFFFGGTRQPDY